jgi:UDP-galactopyranose mutase
MQINDKNEIYLVVGAGFSGAVIARNLAEAGKKVTVIDKRNHVAGNAYDFFNTHGIRVHKYGPHLFHTSNQKVVQWLSRFCEWTDYKHKVKALLADGRYVTLPVNKETREIVGEENIIDTFFRPYTLKMWGVDLEKLDPMIMNRVPIRDDMNELYFPNDEFQALPSNGYTELVSNILDHPLINLKLNTSFSKELEFEYDHVFNSMPIDEYFEYAYGKLPYRSIKFHNIDLPVPQLLPTATVNFTHDDPYTRVTEWKLLPGHGTSSAFTTLTIEEPCAYENNNYERFYPVKDLEGINTKLYKKYKDMTPDNVTFIGRCGLYAYLDMHQAISSAQSIADEFIKKHNFKDSQL